VSSSPFRKKITAYLLDIEGTTTPIDFVYDVLFPYARAHARAYLANHLTSDELRSVIARLREENAEDAQRGLDPPAIIRSGFEPPVDGIVAYIHWLMDHDRKTTPLKSIQGNIWDEGYRKGDLRSRVFEDVPRAFERWRQQGKAIYIYSSGSVLAQKLLFAHTEAGDLTTFISGFFDTNIGPKRSIESYTRIASDLEQQPREIVFVSDVTAELDAAAAAGFESLLCVRPGNPSQPASAHEAIQSFDQIP
jgi:enolase-phosphatase E1